MLTRMIRYEIDSSQMNAFEEFVTGWISVVERSAGTHHGCFLPDEGASDIAYTPQPASGHTRA
jgi:hypothetical protein